jgi:hypothetical protein
MKPEVLTTPNCGEHTRKYGPWTRDGRSLAAVMKDGSRLVIDDATIQEAGDTMTSRERLGLPLGTPLPAAELEQIARRALRRRRWLQRREMRGGGE